MFAFVETVNRDCAAVEQADIDRLHAAGWTDEAIFDAITVCSLFNFYTRIVDATGVHPLSERGFAESGKRIAKFGYLMR